MKYIIKIFKSLFRWMPFSTTYTALDYLYSACVPAIITVVSVHLFDSAAAVLRGDPATRSLYLYAFIYLGIYLINDLSAYVRSITLNAGVYEKGTAYFRMDLYKKLAQLPLLMFEDAEILNRKERAEKAIKSETLSGIFNQTMRLVRSSISVVSVALVLTRYSFWLLPLSLLSVIPYLIARLVRGKEFYYVKRHQAKKTRLLTYLWELFSDRQAAKEMRIMGFDSYLTDKWRNTRDEVSEELWALEKKDALSLLWCDGLRILGYGASVAVVLGLALEGAVSIGVFGAAISAFLSMQNGMQNFLEGIGRLPEQLSYGEDYYSFFDLQDEENGGIPYGGLQNEICLENVSFSYPNSATPALHSISLSIKKGQKIAILGENGSGKTTLSKVLLGLYPPASGQVSYDGVPVNTLDRKGLYRTVSAIAQNFVQYHLTLRENVAISDTCRLEDTPGIQQALVHAGADTGYSLDETIGREFGGKELSGGQWQKLAIARGLFKPCELILLDEPTSALDPMIEADILTQFLDASREKTALIISHRVGLCKLVDRILVMKDGSIAEDGTHEELIHQGGEYARLYTAQEQWYL